MSDMSKETELPLLTSIEIEPGEIAFDPAVNEYTVKLEDGIERLLVRAKTLDADARYTVSGTKLSQGHNEIIVTVTNAQGIQNSYHLHVTVGEVEETEMTFSEVITEALTVQKTESQTVQLTTAPEIQLSFQEHFLTGKNRYITFGICGCAAFAFLLWIVFAIKKYKAKKEKERRLEQRRLEKQEREKRFELARMQQEELLRQIEELTKKSRTMDKTASGLRIIHLNDEYETEEYDDDYDDYDEEDADDN